MVITTLRSRLTAQEIEDRIRDQVAKEVRMFERGRRLHGLLQLDRDIRWLRGTFGGNAAVAERFAPLESTIQDLLDSIELDGVTPVMPPSTPL
jgi:hypothetical protein